MYSLSNLLYTNCTILFQEFFSQKCDASLFMFGSHSKKRPNNIVIGNFYDIIFCED